MVDQVKNPLRMVLRYNLREAMQFEVYLGHQIRYQTTLGNFIEKEILVKLVPLVEYRLYKDCSTAHYYWRPMALAYELFKSDNRLANLLYKQFRRFMDAKGGRRYLLWDKPTLQ